MRLMLNEWRKFLDEAKLAPEWQEQMRLKDEYLADDEALKWVRSDDVTGDIKGMIVSEIGQYVAKLFHTLDEPLGGGPYDPDRDYAKDAKALAQEIAGRDVEALRTRLLAALGDDKAKGEYLSSRSRKSRRRNS